MSACYLVLAGFKECITLSTRQTVWGGFAEKGKCKPIFTLFVKVFTVFTFTAFVYIVVNQQVGKVGLLFVFDWAKDNSIRICSEMVAEFIHDGFSRMFFLLKKERSSGCMTD